MLGRCFGWKSDKKNFNFHSKEQYNHMNQLAAQEFVQLAPVYSRRDYGHFVDLAVNDIARKVGATMGARGKTSGLQVFDENNGVNVSLNTKDGSNTLRAIVQSSGIRKDLFIKVWNEQKELYDDVPASIYNYVASAIWSVASQTEKQSGDGTTATTVLAAAAYETLQKEGIRNLAQFKSDVDDLIVKRVYESAFKDLEEKHVVAIATTSLNGNKEAGQQLGAALFKAGAYGYCFVDTSRGISTDRIEEIEGYSNICGRVSPEFLKEGILGNYPNASIIVSLDPLNVVSDVKSEEANVAHIYGAFDDFQQEFVRKNIGKPQDVLNKLFTKEVKEKWGDSIVIFAPSVGGEARKTLEGNFRTNAFPLKVVFVTFDGFQDGQKTDLLSDVAAITGATIFAKDHKNILSKSSFSTYKLGRCSNVKLESLRFTLFDPKMIGRSGDYNALLKSRIEELSGDNDRPMREWIQRRYAALTGGLVRVLVAATSDAEAYERLDSFQDAQLACFSAMRHGVVTGGGMALLHIADKGQRHFFYEKPELIPLFNFLQSPFCRIVQNTGQSKDDVKLMLNTEFSKPKTGRIKDSDGFDVTKGVWTDFWADDNMILDPAESVANSVKNAVSIATILSNLETLCL